MVASDGKLITLTVQTEVKQSCLASGWTEEDIRELGKHNERDRYVKSRTLPAKNN